jgi:predicted small secreted protein
MSVRSILHALFLLTVVVGGSVALTACNTAKGFGEDVEAGGELMQDGAQDTEDAIED